MQSTICAVLEPISYVFLTEPSEVQKWAYWIKWSQSISESSDVGWGVHLECSWVSNFEFRAKMILNGKDFRRAIWFYIIDSDLFLFERTLFEIIKGPIKNY